jgi:hypothetical protein
MARLWSALATLAWVAVASPASATGSIDCEAVEGGARVAMTVGSLPVLHVVHMEIVANDRTWSTVESGDAAIRVGQAFRDGDRWLIDATDPNIESVVAEIRLNGASDGRDMVMAGTLKIAGSGAYAISCVGP